ncbi:MAG TPA: glycosyltransferase family 4 protein [Acetobacteraceae bacterium]|nr:glycosyltransferase family 4 protein [Acetobacteraceae bacterium]
MTRLALLVPGPFDTVSGGYGYDRAVVAGLRAAGFDVEVLELTGRHPLPDAAAESSARACWARVAPDAVPIIDGLALPAFAQLADGLAARGAVGLIHHPTALEPDRSEADREMLRRAERFLFASLHRILVTSDSTAERLADEFAVVRDRIAVVVPGTNPAPRSAGSGGPGCAILSVGVITPRKGHDVLMRALARLPDLDWHLTIAGGARDIEHAGMLHELAAELAITARVTFAGEVVDDALEALWRRTDLLALATRCEGYGMAIAEALRRGVPVAVTDGGAAGALVTPQTGVVVAVGDDAALSRALRRLIFDRPLREEMRAAAWDAGQKLPDWTTQATAFAAALPEGK